MNSFRIAILFGIICILFNGSLYATSTKYSLSDPDSYPILKDTLIELWREVAIKMCNKSEANFNSTKASCIRVIRYESTDCRATLIPNMPDVIKTKSEAKRYGKEYLDCVLPYYYDEEILPRS